MWSIFNGYKKKYKALVIEHDKLKFTLEATGKELSECRQVYNALSKNLKLCNQSVQGYEATIADLQARIAEFEAAEVGQLVPPTPPTTTAIISGSEVYDCLVHIFPSYVEHIYIADRTYKITTIDELRRFVGWSNVKSFPYTAELHDCDDFAIALAGDFAKYPSWSGFPVSFVWGVLPKAQAHAFCIALAWPSLADRTPTPFYIEPQGDWEMSQEWVENMELLLLPM